MRYLPFILYGLLAVSCATKPIQTLDQSTLVSIAGKPISQEEFLYLFEKNNPLDSTQDLEESLKLFVDFKLKVQEAKRLGYDTLETYRAELASYKEQLKQPFLLKSTLLDSEVKKAYARMSEMLRASHVLIQFPNAASPEDTMAVYRQAQMVADKARAGEDFASLAVAYSDDPSVAYNAGDLGFFTAMQMVKPFEDAAYALKKGQVSAPVKTRFGYHVIKLMERRPHPGELSLSHLILRTVPGDSISNALAQRKIFQLYNELNGENAPTWEKLVATFSEEISTKDNGGKLPGWYGPGTLVAEIEQAAFALTNLGEISAPVKTNFGYHLIRLEGKRPIKSYEEMEESLRGRVMRNTRTEFIEEAAYKQLMSVYDYQEQSNTQEILGTLEKTVASGSLEDLSEEMKTRPLFMLQDSSYRVKDFLPFIASNGQPLNLQYKSYVHAMLDSLEERDLLAENKDYRLLLAEFEEGILLFNLMNDLVWNKSLNDTLGLNQYFATHQSKYRWEPRVDALIVEVLSPTYESTVKEIMSEGAGFEEVKEKLEEKILLRQPTAIQLLEGTFEQSKHPILSKITDNVDYHEVNMDGKLYIVNLKNRQAARPQLLEEVRGQVLMDYQNYLDQQLIDTLRSRYSVMINETVWNEIKQSFE